MVRRVWFAAGMLLLLGGCGGGGDAPTASRSPVPAATKAKEAPTLVFCQRQGEGAESSRAPGPRCRCSTT